MLDQMLARAFQPRQFWDDDRPRPLDECVEDRPMWVYRKTESNLWTVGYYSPADKEWHADSDWADAKDAAARVHWLNGGH